MGSHSFCANLTHFEVGSHSSEAADLDRSGDRTDRLRYERLTVRLLGVRWVPHFYPCVAVDIIKAFYCK